MKKESFDSEVDASMYPLPHFVYTLIKALLKDYPTVFNEIRGLISNSVSILVGIAIARVIKGEQHADFQVKYLALASKLLGTVRSQPDKFKYLEDIYSHSLLSEIARKLGENECKFNSSKSKEQMRVLREVYFEWYEIRKLYEANHTIKGDSSYLPHRQTYKFSKKFAYMKQRDPLALFQLAKSIGDSGSQVKIEIGKLENKI